jgi:hypothetical protein
MLMTMEERCDDFIRRIYDYVGGDVKQQVEDIRPVAKEWGYSESEVDSFLAHFNVKGYIEHSGVGDAYYTIRITPDGIEYVGHMNQ